MVCTHPRQLSMLAACYCCYKNLGKSNQVNVGHVELGQVQGQSAELTLDCLATSLCYPSCCRDYPSFSRYRPFTGKCVGVTIECSGRGKSALVCIRRPGYRIDTLIRSMLSSELALGWGCERL